LFLLNHICLTHNCCTLLPRHQDPDTPVARALPELSGLGGSAGNSKPPELAGFLSAYLGYRNTSLIDHLRESEYSFLDEGGHVYLDYAGAGIGSYATQRACRADTRPVLRRASLGSAPVLDARNSQFVSSICGALALMHVNVTG
jgi:hypothetical protein